jgi:zinc protease
MKSLAGILATGLLLSSAAAAETLVVRVELKNGLVVLLRPVQGADRIAMVTLFAIGGDHDPQGRSGTGHLIEHLYCTAGAGGAKARAFDEFVKRYPDGWNAQTGDDFTVVAGVFKKDALAEELTDAAARMSGLKVADDDLAREVPRVLAELQNMYGGMPVLAARNHARQQVCPGPELSRRGGLPEHIKAITVKDIQDRLDACYKPANATLVLAGGFQAAEAEELVRRHFGDIKPGQVAPQPRVPAPSKLGQTVETTVKPAVPGQSVQVCLAYPAPAPSSPRYAPFLVLVQRMWGRAGGGGWPQSVAVSFALLDDPKVIFITGSVGKDRGQEAVARLERVVADAIAPKLDRKEVQAARGGLAVFLGTEDVPDSLLKGNLYGLAYGIGRRHQMRIDEAKLRTSLVSVDEEALRQTAKEVFSPDRRAAVIVKPQD